MVPGVTYVATMGIGPTLRQELHSCVAEPELAATLPAACYVDAAVYDAEQQAVFRTGWVGVGRSDRWPNAGDYSAMDIGGVPVVVIRDQDNSLRAYANTCMHRAAQIMTGEGNCARMRCPFHFWTYALDGRLVGAPSMQQTPGFDQSEHGLVEFSIAERLGFALLSLDPDAPAIDDWLGDFADVHAPWPLESLVTARRREFTVDCNWKGFAEVFNEYYHLPYVHRTSIDDIYNDPEPGGVVAGSFATQFGTTEGTGGLLAGENHKILPRIEGLTEHAASGVRYSWIFPNLIFALGTEAMWMYEVYPDGPGRVRCAQVVAVPASTFDSPGFVDNIEAYYERFDVAIDEDIPMLEQQHAGQKSPFAKQSRFSYLEPSVARFASWYAERLLADRAVGQRANQPR